MIFSTENATISFPITAADRQQASEFAKQQTTPERRKKTYQNTLAVLVTHYYLAMLGVESDLSSSYSWDTITRLSSNIADLYIPESKGRLECRPIQMGEQTCCVPEEVWKNRIGFIVVQLNETYTEGTLMGYIPKVTVERLPLSYLRSLEDLIDQLSKSPIIVISQWLKDAFEGRGRVLSTFPQSRRPLTVPATRSRALKCHEMTEEELVGVLQTTENEADRWLAAECLWQINPDHPAGGVRKALDLETRFAEQYLTLIIAVLPKSEESVSILIKVYPSEEDTFLPEDLQLTVIDDSKTILRKVQAKRSQWIQIGLSATTGEEICVQVSLDSTSYSEEFIV